MKFRARSSIETAIFTVPDTSTYSQLLQALSDRLGLTGSDVRRLQVEQAQGVNNASIVLPSSPAATASANSSLQAMGFSVGEEGNSLSFRVRQHLPLSREKILKMASSSSSSSSSSGVAAASSAAM